MRLFRPTIPLAIKLEVALRQLGHSTIEARTLASIAAFEKKSGLRLKRALRDLAKKFGCHVTDLRLDHDPALCNREQVIIDGRVLDYIPYANHPDHLFYRDRKAHDVKTRVRGEHGQYSDLAMRRKNKRIEKIKKGKRKYKWPKRKIRNRPWPVKRQT